MILKHGAELEAKIPGGGTALVLACTASGTKEGVATLINAAAKIDASDDAGRTALSLATSFGKLWIVRRLLLAGEACPV